MNTDLDDAMIDVALGDLTATAVARVLPSATVMALRLADVLTSDTPIVTPAFQAELKVYFSDDQILELGSALAVASGWQRFIEAFGIRPDGWTVGTAPPLRPGSD